MISDKAARVTVFCACEIWFTRRLSQSLFFKFPLPSEQGSTRLPLLAKSFLNPALLGVLCPPERFYHFLNPCGAYLEFNLFQHYHNKSFLAVNSYNVTYSSTTTMRATRATREGRMVGLLSSADVSRLPTSQASTRCVGSTGFQYKRKINGNNINIMKLKDKLCINQMSRINRFSIEKKNKQ